MVETVHPIERLRYVARSVGAPQELLVRETAVALAAFSGDPSGLVTACRRIVSRRLASGPMWWLCSRMLTAEDPLAEARSAVEAIEADPTSRRIVEALPDGATVLVLGWQDQVVSALARRGDLRILAVDVMDDAAALVGRLEACETPAVEVPMAGLGAAAAVADLVLFEASAAGPEGFIAVSGSLAAASVAHQAGVGVWAVLGVGRTLPATVWDVVVARFEDLGDVWARGDEMVPLELVDQVVGPDGLSSPETAVVRSDCPIAPELFRADIT